MRHPLILACALAVTCGAGCIGSDPTPPGDSSGTITIDNGSSYVIAEVRVAPTDQVDWGPNLLPDVLYPNEQLTVTVACDSYDVLVSDDLNRGCVLGNVDLCFSNSLWRIDNATLANCGF